eukprot:CAMPEP_0172808484 /NCGR_PEP_ID=MMETSP1075-20121228/7715_1 /TAXON_ID=2916 /ORGANISM="Ceratium fusus, Strain PA161109" /LENGTH=241 /DNA_ID=CAMNT_0013647647 /DNA_START=40 /DNA_END=761 /DNA_ORIENTATION=+
MACCPAGAEPYLASDHKDKGRKGQANGVSYYQTGRGSVGLLLLSDIFGWDSGRLRAIADAFAEKGCNVWIPAVMDPLEGGTDGDGLPPDFNFGGRFMEVVALSAPTGNWNPENVTMAKADNVIKAMLASGVTKFGLIGFCYGAWLGMYVAGSIPAEQLIYEAGAHPSMVAGKSGVGKEPIALSAMSNCLWMFFPCGDPIAGKMKEGPEYDVGGKLFKTLEAKIPGQNRTRRFREMTHGFVT